MQQLEAIAQYWAKAPIGAPAYDPDDAERWLSPWELVYKNQWCRSSVAIGMDNTLRLVGIGTDRLRLTLITDDVHDALLVLIIDDTYVLNYAWGFVSKLPLQRHRVIRQWRFAERGYYTFS